MTDKTSSVQAMFDSIAWRYDFLNHFLSFNVDRIWRRKAIRIIAMHVQNPAILDVATGTADLAIASMKIDPASVKGIDISTKMLEIGRNKINKLGLSDKIELIRAESENIPFGEKTFDVAMAAFGVRNFTDPQKGISEMYRVLKEGGMIMVLEFSRPSGAVFRRLYNFYFMYVLPAVGQLFSKDKKAYRYLPESVMKFPENEKFLELLRIAGFNETRQKKLSGGIASIYTGIKAENQIAGKV